MRLNKNVAIEFKALLTIHDLVNKGKYRTCSDFVNYACIEKLEAMKHK